MTTESNSNDPRVSSVYREIANEKTPHELDEKVLSIAARGVRPRYGRYRAWIRPAAWAATIGLSLAFVLEMSQFADVQDPEIEAGSIEALDEDNVSMLPAASTLKHDVQPKPVREKRSDAQNAAKISTAPTVAAPGQALDSRSVSRDFAASDMGLLLEAEAQAQNRSGSARALTPEAATSQFAEKKEQAGDCDAEFRLFAATWYACIEYLRENDLDEKAELELEALLIEFPDFEVPNTGK